MTATARQVLRDCEALLDDLRQQELWGPMFRPRWAGLVALLRAVGDVAHKVDGKTNPPSPEAVQATLTVKYAHNESNPEAAIFWDFIKFERDSILKAYDYAACVNRTVYVNDPRPSTVTTFMQSGPFAGRDALELAQLAIDYWRAYLDQIDAETARLQKP
jgi:hypothetical protein